MARTRVVLNNAGMRDMLTNTCRPLIAETTARVQAAAGADAGSELVTTDRAAGRVWVFSIAQIRDGTLTRAASSAGLEIRPHS